jgi:hypothetical protein
MRELDWLTGTEVHQMQHYLIDVKRGNEGSAYRLGQRELMTTYLERFATRTDKPLDD